MEEEVVSAVRDLWMGIKKIRDIAWEVLGTGTYWRKPKMLLVDAAPVGLNPLWAA